VIYFFPGWDFDFLDLFEPRLFGGSLSDVSLDSLAPSVSATFDVL
jgi:hypothetical protein